MCDIHITQTHTFFCVCLFFSSLICYLQFGSCVGRLYQLANGSRGQPRWKTSRQNGTWIVCTDRIAVHCCWCFVRCSGCVWYFAWVLSSNRQRQRIHLPRLLLYGRYGQYRKAAIGGDIHAHKQTGRPRTGRAHNKPSTGVFNSFPM